MEKIRICSAGKIDRKKLVNYFRHYSNKKLTESRIECYISHNHTIVAREDKKIVGVLQWHLKEDPSDGNIEFEEIHVLEDYRKKRIGTKLLEFAVKEVKKTLKKEKIKPRKIFLFVGAKNTAAKKLYRKVGFKKVCSVGKLLSDKTEELLYELRL